MPFDLPFFIVAAAGVLIFALIRSLRRPRRRPGSGYDRTDTDTNWPDRSSSSYGATGGSSSLSAPMVATAAGVAAGAAIGSAVLGSEATGHCGGADPDSGSTSDSGWGSGGSDSGSSDSGSSSTD